MRQPRRARPPAAPPPDAAPPPAGGGTADLDAYIAKILDAAPPLTPGQRASSPCSCAAAARPAPRRPRPSRSHPAPPRTPPQGKALTKTPGEPGTTLTASASSRARPAISARGHAAAGVPPPQAPGRPARSARTPPAPRADTRHPPWARRVFNLFDAHPRRLRVRGKVSLEV